jgi:hypothetical protein
MYTSKIIRYSTKVRKKGAFLELLLLGLDILSMMILYEKME